MKISFPRFVAGVLLLIGLGLLVSCSQRGAAAHDSKNVLTLTKGNFQSEVLASSQPVLVDFWASWCGPCRAIAPIVAELAVEFEGRIKVGKVDVDAQRALAEQYGIRSIPALLIFKDGKQVDQVIGLRSKNELHAKLSALVPAGAVTPVPAQP